MSEAGGGEKRSYKICNSDGGLFFRNLCLTRCEGKEPRMKDTEQKEDRFVWLMVRRERGTVGVA